MYASHPPPSIRYEMFATPLVASVAFNATVTLDVYHPFAPTVPDREMAVVGGTVSTRMVTVCDASGNPALFTA